MDQAIVEPSPTADAVAEVTPTAPQAKGTTAPALSDELLQIPALQAVFAGQPAAVSASLKDFQARPEGKLIAEHKDELMKAGMGLYRSLNGDLGVIFNLLHIHPEQLKAADKAGQLLQVAPSFDDVNAQVASSGADHPVLKAQGVPNGPAAAPLASPPQATSGMVAPPSTSVAPAASGAQRLAESAKIKALTTDKPTAGSRAGAGALLRSILKPVV